MSEMNDYMKKHRLENKLRLFDTPGFSQFVGDLGIYLGNRDIHRFADVLKKLYTKQLKEIEEKDSKFKQGELEL